MSKFARKTAVFMWLVSGPALAKALPEPVQTRALESAVRGLAGVAPGEDRLLLLPLAGADVLSVPFDPKGATSEQVFGKLSDQQHLEVAKGQRDWQWAGAVQVPERMLLLDGATLTLVEADPKTLKEITRRTVAWDLIKPPRDRGGEPTTPETAALRAKFKQRFLATPGQKLAGFAALPAAWHASKKQVYAVATRIKDFPLVLLECERGEPSSCVISRQCYLEGVKIAPDAVAGIGVSAARRQLVIGDAERRQLIRFRYDSCFHVAHTADLELPAKLKPLTSVAVDAADRLWVTTATPDDYLNASVFFWPAETW